MKKQDIIENDIVEIVRRVGSSFERLSGKTLLITGPNGLLGSYLVDTVAYLNDFYLKKPCKVLGLTRSPINKNGRLGHLLNRKDIHLIQHNVVKPLRIKKPVHFVIHAAGKSAPKLFQADPIGTIDVNILGLRWLLELACKDPVESFMFFSSADVYGEPSPENIPTPEEYNGSVFLTSLRACYSESKRCGEVLCLSFYRERKVPVKIVRPFIIYGPGLSPSDPKVMADFIRSVMHGKPITMLGDGKSTRAYCYISDATVAFWKILLSDKNGEIYNVGSNREEISIKEMAEIMHEIVGIKESPKSKTCENMEYLKSAPSRVCPDITKIRLDFNFNPEVLIKEGIRRTIEWNLAK